MKRLNIIIMLFALSAMLVSCGNIKNKVEESLNEISDEITEDFNSINTITVSDTYTIDLPSFLSEADDLNEEASVQYQNLSREYYVIVIDENKQDFFDAVNEGATEEELIGEEEILDIYAYLQFTTFATDEQYFGAEVFEVNNMSAQKLDIVSTFDNYNIFYRMACIEGTDNLYFVVTWTLDTSKDTYDESMQAIVESIKEI